MSSGGAETKEPETSGKVSKDNSSAFNSSACKDENKKLTFYSFSPYDISRPVEQTMSPSNAERKGNTFAKQVATMSREERLEAVKKQVEYYFSPENLRNDPYLTSQMDAQRTVPLAVIVKFPKLKTLMDGDSGMLQEAIAASSAISLTESGDRIKANLLDREGSAGTNRNTIIIRDVAADATEDEIRDIFNFDDKKGDVVSVRSDIGNCWFVEMNSESAAKDTLLQLKLKGRKFRGEGVKARLKTDSVVRSYFSQPSQPSAPMQQPGMGAIGGPGAPSPGGMPLGINFMPYGQFPPAYGIPAQGMGVPPGGFPPGANIPGFTHPINIGPGGLPIGMMPLAGPGGMPTRGMYPQDDTLGGVNPRGPGAASTKGERGGVSQNEPSSSGHTNGNTNTNTNGGGGARRGGGSQDERYSQGRSTDRGGSGASGAGNRGKSNKGSNGGNHRENSGKGGKKGKDGGSEHKPKGYVVDVSSFPQLGALPVDDTPIPTPGYKGDFKKYSHDEIVTIVSQINEVKMPLDMHGNPLDPTVHAHAMSKEANMDLLQRQRSFSMEEYREQLKQGVPVAKEALITGDTDTPSSVARATSIAFGEVESETGSRTTTPTAAAAAAATASVAVVSELAASDVAKQAATAAIDQSIDTAAAYMEAKASMGSSGGLRGAAAVPSMSTWAALAARAAATQTEPTEPTPKRSVGVGTAASPTSAAQSAKNVSSASESGKSKGKSGGGRGKEKKVGFSFLFFLSRT